MFSMKNTVNRPTSWLPLVIPALQTGRLSLGDGWTIRIHFRTALAALQDHLQKKGMGEEKGERRGERERMESSKKGKAGAVRVWENTHLIIIFFLVLNINSKVTTTQAPL